ncbi:class I SAM-dependent methyltransferase [Cryobacterium algoritolerans]|uniref:Class I SAM-dependent methyltransferase n=1 Tax=Cryobacterium algoritolerans TaxID=1259184 RepID=A0A4R8WXT9_9MICO|nr:class I SAM-dependent methyltransferase [Cryobacterium algoritolerans]TFC17623.1 class I SAM-dependent methyltransferase [Cryobacterium algoritolerans]
MDAHEWDDRYRQAREGHDARLWSAVPAQLVQDTVAPWQPGRALDLATGDGRNAIWLAGRGWQVTGLDFSAEAIAQAGEHARAAGVHVDWLVADATTWQPEGRFDLVTVMYLHLPEVLFRTLLARMLGWLTPGGHLLVLGHDRANIGVGGPGPGNPDILYTPELLSSIVGPERVLRCETVSRDLATDPESPADTGGVALDTVLVARA